MDPLSLADVDPDRTAEVEWEIPQVHPEIAGKATRIIAGWSKIEANLIVLAAGAMHFHANAVAEILATVHSPTLRVQLIRKALAEEFTGEELKASNEVLLEAERIAAIRNRYSHEIWGSSPQLPECLLLVHRKHALAPDVKYLGSLGARLRELDLNGDNLTDERIIELNKELSVDSIDPKKVRVVTSSEIHLQAMRTGLVNSVIHTLSILLHTPAPDDELRQELLDLLDHLREIRLRLTRIAEISLPELLRTDHAASP